MVERNGDGKTKRNKPMIYFYLNGDLHQRLHVNRVTDTLVAWNHRTRKRVGYSYSDVMRRAERAYKTKEVGLMFNRTRLTLERGIINGDIPAPQKSYSITTGTPKGYWWNEEDIMNAWDFLSQVHRGRPRKDGLVTTKNIPSLRELRAMLRQEVILYVQTDDGEFIPSWKAKDIL